MGQTGAVFFLSVYRSVSFVCVRIFGAEISALPASGASWWRLVARPVSPCALKLLCLISRFLLSTYSDLPTLPLSPFDLSPPLPSLSSPPLTDGQLTLFISLFSIPTPPSLQSNCIATPSLGRGSHSLKHAHKKLQSLPAPSAAARTRRPSIKEQSTDILTLSFNHQIDTILVCI